MTPPYQQRDGRNAESRACCYYFQWQCSAVDASFIHYLLPHPAMRHGQTGPKRVYKFCLTHCNTGLAFTEVFACYTSRRSLFLAFSAIKDSSSSPADCCCYFRPSSGFFLIAAATQLFSLPLVVVAGLLGRGGGGVFPSQIASREVENEMYDDAPTRRRPYASSQTGGNTHSGF